MARNSTDSFNSEVRQLWAALEAKRSVVKIFQPASEKEISAFERRYKIELPEDYRQFLLQVSNGGGWLHSLNDFDKPGSFKGIPGEFRKPFPHRRKWNLTARQFARMPEEGIDDAGYAAFWKDYFKPERINGAIPICEGGCSRWYLLVVTGNERGKVWIDERGSETGVFPAINAQGRHLRFSAWYVAFLSFSLKRKPRGWVV